MGKINGIQEEVKQSFGSNSFTTTVKENTIEFDSAKDSFTFLDPVNIQGALTINGEEITPAQPQVQADWNQNDGTQPDYIENKPFYETPQIDYVETTLVYTNYTAYFDWDVAPTQIGNFYQVRYTMNDGTSITVLGECSEYTQYDPSGISISFGQGSLYYTPSFSQEGKQNNGKYMGNPSVVSVKVFSQEIHKIDDKFISDNIKNGILGTIGTDYDFLYDYLKPKNCYYYESGSTGTATKTIKLDFSEVQTGNVLKFRIDTVIQKVNGGTNVSNLFQLRTAGSSPDLYSNISTYDAGGRYLIDITYCNDVCEAIFTKVTLIS